jgi:hypothetical protein
VGVDPEKALGCLQLVSKLEVTSERWQELWGGTA